MSKKRETFVLQLELEVTAASKLRAAVYAEEIERQLGKAVAICEAELHGAGAEDVVVIFFSRPGEHWPEGM